MIITYFGSIPLELNNLTHLCSLKIYYNRFGGQSTDRASWDDDIVFFQVAGE